MAYQALYRKFRPDEFAEVKGQEHIVRTLKNQVMSERIGHAYLFCGTRGTGKTTIAKLLAKAVNCENPIDGSPCNECPTCKAIKAQTSMNVIEIDAASNNGVDNIREIRDNVQYPPTQGKYKVYIIDEVHMLSPSAFPALLKTLEEPPSYVIFILATTEAHKIPITIKSRCQRYDFKRISIDTIAQRLTDLMQREQITVEEKAIRYIAKAGDGSMRDALSLLDQCISFHIGETLTYEHVLEILGAVDTEVLSALFHTIVNKDVSALLKQIEMMVMDGREMGQMVSDFTWYLRNLLMIQETPELEDALDMSKEQYDVLAEDAKQIETDTLMRYIRICSELSTRLRLSTQKRVDVEIAFIKLCKPQMETDTESLLERVRELESKLEAVDAIAGRIRELEEHGVTASVSTVSYAADAAPSPSLHEQLYESLEPAQIEDLKVLVEQFPKVRELIGREDAVLGKYFSRVYPAIGDANSEFSLIIPELTTKNYIMDRISTVKSAFAEVCGKNVEFAVKVSEGNQEALEFANLCKLINMEIEKR